MRGCTCERCHAAYKAYHREWQRRGAAKPRSNALYRRIASQAAELYRSGLSLNQVGALLGVSHNTVDNALRFAGVEKRPVGNPDNLRFVNPANMRKPPPRPQVQTRIMAEAIRLQAEGLPQHEIATRLEVSPITVWRALNRHRREGVTYNSNCPCVHCWEGKKRYWTARQMAVKAGAAEVGKHGTGGYRQGCRCEVCRTAVRKKRQAERAAKR